MAANIRDMMAVSERVPFHGASSHINCDYFSPAVNKGRSAGQERKVAFGFEAKNESPRSEFDDDRGNCAGLPIRPLPWRLTRLVLPTLAGRSASFW